MAAQTQHTSTGTLAAAPRRRRGFSTVEILVAVGLVAILMVVAIPRLLDSRRTVSDSSAKQQLNTVLLSVNNWFAERDTYTGVEAAIGSRVPEVKIVAAGQLTGKNSAGGGRALTVSVDEVSASEVIMVASNGDANCWGIKVNTSGTWYAGKSIASCTTSTFAAADWAAYEFPNIG